MMKKKLTLLFVLTILIIIKTNSQTQIRINPYLQDALPNSISILWETNQGTDSKVEWGLTQDLGNESIGISYPSDGGAEMIHEVQIENLERFTKYYYRVITDDASSDIYQFKTPPFALDNEPFRIVAMSDMQRDGAFPDRFREIVEEGILDYFEAQFGTEIIENLALVMIPGDLVVNGNNYNSWQSTFFQPSEKLASQIPFYPVPGNHENDAVYFFRYFKLPENGTQGFQEHWWHKDYGNLRIIGLDSNNPYAGEEQLEWIDQTLENTCTLDSIDFVFAQLHHPHKSELWTPGESDFTGEVIQRLEEFSSQCGKPSIHFFGHTHGYSRGQSRDHKHLWINVATAGGAIDNWGEFPNMDYEEFSVSQDEYGFVMIEISSEPEPKINIKRISRGDQNNTLNNVIRDSLSVTKDNKIINTPVPNYPINITLPPECVQLIASEFSAIDIDALHGQSHWQVAPWPGNFDNLVIESWKNYENWYYDVDTQQSDDLTDETFFSLNPQSNYQWRVRYRDRRLNWSNWSNSAKFSTGESIALPNLIQNPGSEEDLDSWLTIEGVAESLIAEECNGIFPYQGERYFAIGGLCEHSDVGRVIQNIDLNPYADSIDTGTFPIDFGGYFSNYSGSDQPQMRLIYLNDTSNEIGQSPILTSLNSSWTQHQEHDTIPIGTRHLQVELQGTRNAGTDNDSYFDELYLSIGVTNPCPTIISSNEKTPIVAQNLSLHPNPSNQSTTAKVPAKYRTIQRISITNIQGQKFFPPYDIDQNKITVKTNSLSSGTYIITAVTDDHVIYSNKLIVLHP